MLSLHYMNVFEPHIRGALILYIDVLCERICDKIYLHIFLQTGGYIYIDYMKFLVLRGIIKSKYLSSRENRGIKNISKKYNVRFYNY